MRIMRRVSATRRSQLWSQPRAAEVARDLHLFKTPEAAILAPQPPEIWEMSVYGGEPKCIYQSQPSHMAHLESAASQS